MSRRPCEICGEPVKARGLCGKHLMRLNRHGDPLAQGAKVYGTADERFEAYANRGPADACWPWGGTIVEGGYGQLWDGSKIVAVHRWAYQRFIEPIPPGWTVDHVWQAGCRLKDCVNYLNHLEAVTNAENVHRYWDAQRQQGLCSSEYRGIYWDEYRQRWHAQIWSPETGDVNLGLFQSELRAARARDRAALEQDGLHAWLNFPLNVNQYSPLTGQ